MQSTKKAGIKIPKKFENFQKMKYNNGIEYRSLKVHYDMKIKYNMKVHERDQGKHIKGHNNNNGKSYLYDWVDPQELVDKYNCAGEIRYDRKGNWTNKEFIELDISTGEYVEDIKSFKTN